MDPRAMSVAVPAPSMPCVGREFDVDAFSSRETAASPMRADVDSWTVSRPVSDVRTSGMVLGIGITSKGIAFHFETIDSLKVVTWSHRDLTYALVSKLTERGQKSCMVCHQGAKDRDFIEGLALVDGAPITVADVGQPIR